jgi:SAM-dependent methyltransferase
VTQISASALCYVMSMAPNGWLLRSMRALRALHLRWVLADLRLRPGWRTRSNPVRGRRRALNEELAYWSDHLSTGGGKYPDGYAYRFDPAAEVADPALREILGAITQREVSVLDVGAGPAPFLGYRFPGKILSVAAVDPLADDYNLLLERAGIVPPVRTERLEGERLVERFGHDRFDIAYSRNALDHAVDPTLIIKNMLAVVRPGGYVVLRHARNEAVRQRYRQLHQWNFDERGGELVVWREGQETNVTEALAGHAEVSFRTSPTEEYWIVCVIKKVAGQGRRDHIVD